MEREGEPPGSVCVEDTASSDGADNSLFSAGGSDDVLLPSGSEVIGVGSALVTDTSHGVTRSADSEIMLLPSTTRWFQTY